LLIKSEETDIIGTSIQPIMPLCVIISLEALMDNRKLT
jgi:hypothetical protein